jgi:tetratricopeptide (TPR) repeat protein
VPDPSLPTEQSSPVAEESDATISAPKRRQYIRWLFLVLAALAIAAGAVPALMYWQERPLRQAREALDQRQPEAALNRVTEHLLKNPQDTRALAFRARVLTALGRPHEAIQWFERISAAEPDDLHAWAQAYLMTEQFSRAVPVLERFLELRPDDADALYEITACYTRLGRFDEATETASRFAKIPGQEARGYLFLGTIQSDLDNTRQAANYYARVLQFDPEVKSLQVPGEEFLLQYGHTLLRAGRPVEARTVLEKSIAIRPTSEGYAMLGDARSQSGQPSEAAEAWKAALAINPAHLGAREGLANAALVAGNGENALEWLTPLESSPAVRSSTAYLLQRAYTIAKSEEKASLWREKTQALRHREAIQANLNNLLIVAPQTFWARVIRAYRFAESGNRIEAEEMIAALEHEAPEEPFVADLARAVRDGGPLPSLERLPLKLK